MSPGSITAVSSVCGKQNVQLVSHFLRNLNLQPSDPIYLISPTQYFAVFFVVNFSSTKSSGSSSWTMQSAPLSQLPYSVNSSVSWKVKSEPDMSGFVLYISVTHVLTSFLSLGLEGPIILLLPARSWISSFSAVRVTILYIFFQPSTTSADAVLRHWIWTNVFWFHFLSQRAAYCATDEVVQPQLTL